MTQRFRTLREAKNFQTQHTDWRVFKLHGKVFKFFVGSEFQWLNL